MTWILTGAGHRLDLLDPDPALIDLEEIAASLGRKARFSDLTRFSWTVAEHSLFVAKIARDRDPGLLAAERQALTVAALLHDAHEAYIGDISAPVKSAIAGGAGRDLFAEIEARLDRAIFARFGVADLMTAEISAAVRTADKLAVEAEIKRLFPDTPARDAAVADLRAALGDGAGPTRTKIPYTTAPAQKWADELTRHLDYLTARQTRPETAR